MRPVITPVITAPTVAPVGAPATPAVAPVVAPVAPVVAPVAPVVAPIAPVVAPVAPAGAPRPSVGAPAPGPARPVVTPMVTAPGAGPAAPAAAQRPAGPPRPPGAPGSGPPRPPGAPGAPAAIAPPPPAARPVAPVITPAAPAAPAAPVTAPVMVPPAPGAAPALGEFDPFASESVKAMVPPPAPAGAPPAPAAPPVQPAVQLPPPAFAETGAIEAVTPQAAVALAQIIGVLNDVDYFQVLRVPHDAKLVDIKKAFYRESRTYHPDRFFHLSDADVKTDVGTVYKRITEAYYFLKDDTKRKKYLADISGPERKAKLRFTEASEVETKQQQKKEQEEQIGTHPKGRQFYATAMKDIDARRWSDAQRNLKSALMYERDNARYKEKLAEVEQKLHDEFKSKGEQFKIR